MKSAHAAWPRAQFTQQIQGLQQDLLRMGSVVEQMLHKSMEAYRHRKSALVREVMDLDDIVDRFNRDIEVDALHLLALQNPMARDLRVIAATLKIITDIERMGDYCIDIAKASDRVADQTPIDPVPELAEMAALASLMLRETLQAFVSRDMDLVQQMILHDDEVDHMNRKINDDMVNLIRRDPSVAPQAIAALMIARYLERIADHVTNVGERVYYMETGEFKELHV